MKLHEMLKILNTRGYSDSHIAGKVSISVPTINRIRNNVAKNCRIQTAEKIKTFYETATGSKVESYL